MLPSAVTFPPVTATVLSASPPVPNTTRSRLCSSYILSRTRLPAVTPDALCSTAGSPSKKAQSNMGIPTRSNTPSRSDGMACDARVSAAAGAGMPVPAVVIWVRTGACCTSATGTAPSRVGIEEPVSKAVNELGCESTAVAVTLWLLATGAAVGSGFSCAFSNPTATPTESEKAACVDHAQSSPLPLFALLRAPIAACRTRAVSRFTTEASRALSRASRARVLS